METLAQADHAVQSIAKLFNQAQCLRDNIKNSIEHSANIVTTKKFSELTGYSLEAIKGKINNGVWIEGMIWHKAPDGRRMLDMEAYDKWARGELKQA